jgi:hypothetical protein
MPEVQLHGKVWESDLICHVYKATEEERKSICYTSALDLPAALNHLDGVDVSIKTTGTANAVCMGDCLRVFDKVSSGAPLHMTVVTYEQSGDTKRLVSLAEVDLTGSTALLFGTLTREQIRELDAAVKAVPGKRKPTPEEHTRMYSLRNELHLLTSAIHLDIKCNSQQSRLQCSFNRFQDFLRDHPERIIAQSTTGMFRGGAVATEVASGRRVFTTSRGATTTTVAPGPAPE